MLVDGVDGVRTGWVRRARQYVRLSRGADDVGGVSAAGTFGVKRVDRAIADSRERRLDEPRLVESVGMNRDLDVELVGDREAGINRFRGRSPVLVQLEAHRSSLHLLTQRQRIAGVALAEESEVHRERLGGL